MDDVTHPQPGDRYIGRHPNSRCEVLARFDDFIWVRHEGLPAPITHDLEVVNYWTLEVPCTK